MLECVIDCKPVVPLLIELVTGWKIVTFLSKQEVGSSSCDSWLNMWDPC